MFAINNPGNSFNSINFSVRVDSIFSSTPSKVGAYFEINSINENQLIGGIQDNNWSVTCGTYRVRFSNLNIERIRSI